jgi:hypothetical protein
MQARVPSEKTDARVGLFGWPLIHGEGLAATG